MWKFLSSALLLATAVLANEPAPAPTIDSARVTVSGLSAGGQMAHQLHIAYSDLFSGVAIIAGGPFGCAAGSVATAFARCMTTTGPGLPPDSFSADIRAAAQSGSVADPSGLADDPVWLFHGALDTTVAEGVSDALEALYREFVPAERIRYVKDVAAGHNFPARGRGQPCDATQPPFVGDCDYDAAGELLKYLYPGLQKPADVDSTALVQVALPGAQAAGLVDKAYLFIPPACANGAKPCALHLVLHGCAQSSAQLGTDFIEQSGYLEWAAANDIVLAFPQVATGPANPLACWDWWGYTGANYLWRDGPQMKVLADWVMSMTASQ